MTTTTANFVMSSKKLGVRHVYAEVYGSTLTSGENWLRGIHKWRVVRDNAVVSALSLDGPPSFSYLCENDGDQIYVQTVDEAGNEGAWVASDPIDVDEDMAAAADAVQYVDPTSGSNANNGLTSGAAVQTVAQARTNIKAAWVTGGSHVIFLKRGETFAVSPLWDGHTAAGRICFEPYGSGADPIVNQTTSDTVCGSGQTSIQLRDIYFDIGENLNINLDGGFTRSSPYDFIALRCTLKLLRTGFGASQIGGSDSSSRSATDRDAGDYDFVAVQDCLFDSESVVFPIYGLAHSRYGHIVGNTFSHPTAAVATHAFRVWNVSDWFVKDNIIEINSENAAGMRFATYEGDGLDSATRRIVLVNNLWDIASAGPYAHEDGSNGIEFFVRDVSVYGGNRMFGIYVGGGGYAGSGVNVDRILNRNAAHVGPYSLWPHASIGTWGKFGFIDCAFSHYEGGETAIRLGAAVGRYSSSFLTFEGNVNYYHNSSTSNGPAYMFWTSAMTLAEFTGLVSSSDHNVVAKNGTTTYFIVDSVDFYSLSHWQTNSAFDDNSYQVDNQTIAWTTTPSSGTAQIDPRLSTSGGYLQSKGRGASYAIDIDGHLRGTDNYAGPHEYGATTEPGDPDLGGGGGDASRWLVGASLAGRSALLGGLVR